tara:strand:- start:113 stop:505 length:393 start_codon:yes stop_codon:yes gene_type:complete
MVCPNYELNTNKFLESLGIKPTPMNRTRIFYTICIMVRLLIAGIVLQLKNKVWLPYVVFIISLITSYRLFKNLRGNWWWSRSFHLIVSMLLVLISFLLIIKKLNNPELIAYLLYFDVLGGLIYSLGVTRC